MTALTGHLDILSAFAAPSADDARVRGGDRRGRRETSARTASARDARVVRARRARRRRD